MSVCMNLYVYMCAGHTLCGSYFNSLWKDRNNEISQKN